MITQKELVELLNYKPDTGQFFWRSSGSGRNLNKEAGCFDKLGYRQICINRRLYPSHRLVWLYLYGEWPKHQIDHINGNPGDNRIENLRDVTPKENQRNKKTPSSNSTGVVGISICKSGNNDRYKAYISHNNKQKTLGYYPDLFSAVCARRSAESKYGYHENHGRQ